MSKSISIFASLLVVFLPLSSLAQVPANTGTYYQSADGTKGASLKTAMFKIISKHKDVGYDGLWNVYKKSDVRPDGKLWDVYSSITNFTIGGSAQGASYKKEGDGYNREHTVPQSWFDKANPMRSDAFHVVPSDGYVNNRRGNYPFGEVNPNAVTFKSINNFCRLGISRTPGYNQTVFEPADEYKGDFARIYFYMCTAYQDRCTGWGGVFQNNTYQPIVDWQMNMLLRWAKEDPVSKKEIDRNNAIFEFQNNRNPFVDYPGLEEYVWGDKKNDTFSHDNYNSTPTLASPELSFQVTNVSAILGKDFTSPVLHNPHNLPVAYSSTNNSVATVDNNGVVTLHSTGATTIRAAFSGNAAYRAGEASYTLSVTNAEGDNIVGLPYNESFSETQGFFTIDNKQLSNKDYVWIHDIYNNVGMMKATGYYKINLETESWLVSPLINLAETSKPVLSFEHAINSYFNGNLAEEIYAMLQADNGEWVKMNISYPVKPSKGYSSFITVAIDLSQYRDQNIKIAFVYTSHSNSAGTWEIRNVSVQDSAPTGINSISYDANTTAVNLQGVRVDDTYKGIVIRNGRKYIQK